MRCDFAKSLDACREVGGLYVTNRVLTLLNVSGYKDRAKSRHAKSRQPRRRTTTDMLALIPQFAVGAGGLMVTFLLMSGLAMLIVVLVSGLYVFSVNAASTSYTIDVGLAVLSFVLGKLWTVSLLPVVALCNAVGGGAVGASATVDMFGKKAEGVTTLVVTLIAALIGAVSLSGSLTAWTKLNGIIKVPLWIRGQQTLSLVLMVTVLIVGGYIVFAAPGDADQLITISRLIYSLLGCALLLGVLITLPIRKARIFVAIYFYNAFTGLAIGLEGFVLKNPGLMIAGLAVGSVRMLVTLPITKTLL